MKCSKLLQKVLLCAALPLTAIAAADTNKGPQRIEVQAKRFSFSPDHITVKRGQPVTLVIHSDDVAHGLSIKPLNVNVEEQKGGSAEVTFVPEQSGKFEGECSRFCGAGHGSMNLVVEVTN